MSGNGNGMQACQEHRAHSHITSEDRWGGAHLPIAHRGVVGQPALHPRHDDVVSLLQCKDVHVLVLFEEGLEGAGPPLVGLAGGALREVEGLGARPRPVAAANLNAAGREFRRGGDVCACLPVGWRMREVHARVRARVCLKSEQGPGGMLKTVTHWNQQH